MRSAKSLLPGVEFAERAHDCLEGADAAVVMTEWDEFRALDLKRVRAALTQAIMVDLRNIYSIETMKALGFRYVCIGRGLDRKSNAGSRATAAHTDNKTSSPPSVAHMIHNA
jgi:UDPglucose 6-dehydrogenase